MRLIAIVTTYSFKMFSATDRYTKCKKCGEGHYQNNPGQESCLAVPPGNKANIDSKFLVPYFLSELYR